MAAILYFVMTGEPPFAGSDINTILAQQLQREVDLSGLARPVAEFIEHGLHPDPAERFGDGAAMRTAWRELVAERHRESRRQESWWGRVLGRADD
jgi:hypothetical protein